MSLNEYWVSALLLCQLTLIWDESLAWSKHTNIHTILAWWCQVIGTDQRCWWCWHEPHTVSRHQPGILQNISQITARICYQMCRITTIPRRQWFGKKSLSFFFAYLKIDIHIYEFWIYWHEIPVFISFSSFSFSGASLPESKFNFQLSGMKSSAPELEHKTCQPALHLTWR